MAKKFRCHIVTRRKSYQNLDYGVKSSGNQAERGLMETARSYKDKYPEVNNIIQKDVECR